MWRPAYSAPASTIGTSPIAVFAGDDSNGGSQLQKWSSIIGIVTAIIGNVLISFALNTQRYAHLRLAREYNDSHTPLKTNPNRRNKQNGYGTLDQQERIAEERLQANLAPENGSSNGSAKPDDTANKYVQAEETDPAIGSEDSSEKNGEGEQKSYLWSPYWWAGIAMMIIGEAGNFIAYGFAPASIVSPLGVVALVSNCIIAPFLLKERFRKRDGAGVFIAVAGAVVIVLSARDSEDKMGPGALWDSIRRWEFLLYLGITALFILVLIWASGKYGQKSILIDLGLVGLFGGYTALSTKGVASLLSYTLWRALTFPITYVLVLVLVLSALAQIRYVNRALQRFDSTQVIPTQFVLFTISVIVGSAVLYRDFESATADRVGKFIAGCFLTFLGVYLITSGRKDKSDDYDDDLSGDEEEQIGLIDEEAEQTAPSSRGKLGRTLSSQMDSKLLPPGTPDGGIIRRSSTLRSDLRTPPQRPSTIPSSTPSIAVTPESALDDPSPFTSLADRVPPWNDAASSRSKPPLQSTQSSSRIETYTPPSGTQRPNISAPSLVRLPTAPSDPTTPPTTSSTHSPPKADPSSTSRISLIPSTPENPQPPSTTTLRSTRNSISRLMPGPLISPLSSSLSAVVADSIRRGEGSVSGRRASLRRNRTSTRSQQGLVEQMHRRSIAEGELLLHPNPRPQSPQQQQSLHRTTSARDSTIGLGTEDVDVGNLVGRGDVSTKEKKNRLRSMSEGISGLMTGRKNRRKTKGDGNDEGEEGAGGSSRV